MKALIFTLLICLLGFTGFGASEYKGVPVCNLTPSMSSPRGSRNAKQKPNCRIAGGKAVLTTPAYKAVFGLEPRLSLKSLICAEVARDVIVYPGQSRLFRLKLASGHIINGTSMEIKKITPVENGFAADLIDRKSGLECVFTAQADVDELRMGLTVTNRGNSDAKFMVAFPHLDGIALSGQGDDDYYLFPWSDGVINGKDIRIRSVYGGTDNGMWQMMNLYSPKRGGGIYLRADDPEGINKGMCFRRGKNYAPGFHWAVPDENDAPGRVDRSMNYYDNLDIQNGAAFSFDYQMYNRAPGAQVKLPDACLGTHSGSWKNAMKRYVAWSNKTWPHRNGAARNANRWNRTAGHDSTNPIYLQYDIWEKRVKGELPPDNRASDIYEFVGWWTNSRKGPWGIELDNVNKETMGEIGTGMIKAFTSRDPATKILWYDYNLGDYDGYNPQWGGLDALRKFFKNIQSMDNNVTLYFDPMQSCSESEYGAKYGAKYVCINPAWTDYFKCPRNPETPEGAIFEHCMYCMCINDADYVNDFVQKVKKACQDTGVDGVRLDVCGSVGFICLSKKHNHVFKEEGQNVWTQAQFRAAKLVREALDEVNPELTLETEYAQNDHLASLLDGACAYGTGTCLVPIRPVPVNLFRFYFPYCRQYQINPNGQKEFFDFCLFNADGTLDNYGYSKKYTAILKENIDAFTGEVEPLIDTLTEHLYVNEFKSRTEDKVVWTLLNYSGKDLADAPVFNVDDSGKYRYVELISDEEITPVNGKLYVSMKDRQVLVICKQLK